MESMTKEEFRRKYQDTHRGLHCTQVLEDGRKDSSLIKKSSGDRNITSRGKIPGKTLIERKAMEDRSDDFKHYLLDAVSVRKTEILDKKEVPMTHLLQIVTKNLPQKLETKNEHSFTFADMVKKATIELTKVDTVDTEAEVS